MNRNLVVQFYMTIFILVIILSLCITQSHAQGCDDTTDYFIFTPNTGDNYAIVIDSTSLDCSLIECDEIGVFDGDLCVGASVFHGTWPLAVTAWKDDTQTSGVVDGYVGGNPITFKVWHSSDDSEFPFFEAIYSSGDGNFESGFFSQLWLGCSCPTLIGPDPSTLSPPVGDTGRIEVTFVWESVQYAWAYAIKIDSVSQGPGYLMMYDTVFDTSLSIVLPFDTLQFGNPKSIFWQVQPLGFAPCPDGDWTSPAVYTDVEEYDIDNLPTIFNMSQNYPNPFNPTTTIEFNLPTKSNVTVTIYNLLGQEIQQLVNQEYSVGNYKVAWDGTTSNGVKTATGIYFYRIKTDDFVETRKMLLLK